MRPDSTPYTSATLGTLNTVGKGVLAFTERPLVFPLALYFMAVPLRLMLAASPLTEKLELRLLIASTLFMAIDCLRRKRMAVPGSSVVFLAGFLVFSLASSQWTVARKSPNVLGALALASMTFVAAVYRPAARDLKVLQLVASLVGGATVCLMLYNMDTISTYFAKLGSRVSLSFGGSLIEDPNDFALFLTVSLAASYGMFHSAHGAVGKITALCLTGFILYGITLTSSRSGSLGAGIVLIYLTMSRSKRGIAAGLVALTALIWFLGRLESTDLLISRWTDEAVVHGSGRTYIWEIGKARFKEAWLFGHGMDSFSTVFYEMGQFQFRAAHSIYLTLLVENGVVGFFLFMVAIGLSFRALVLADRGKERWISAAFLTTLVQAIFLSVLWTKLFWLVWTLAFLGRNAFSAPTTHSMSRT